MSTPKEYLNVNWVNGMKINKDHFIQQENAFKDELKDSRTIHLNDRNYGLLPEWSSKNSSFEIVTKIDNQNSLKVKILQCHAITLGGARIKILKNNDLPEFIIETPETDDKENNGNDLFYYLILSIDLFLREPYGNFNSDEDPPRHLFSIPSLKLNLISNKQISNEGIHPYSLFIGKVIIENGIPKVLTDYLPPCMTNMSHPKLVSFHSGVDKLFGQIEIDLVEIISKIKNKDQKTSLANSTLVLSQKLLDYLNNNILNFRWSVIDLPPIIMFERIASIARIIKNTIDCNISSDKEEMLNYFTNWSEMKPGDFEKLLLSTINFKYDHFEINKTMVEMKSFIELTASLFEKLSTLAYIGKKKETGIFVKEHKSKRSFLAD